jgi:hypothetical protein
MLFEQEDQTRYRSPHTPPQVAAESHADPDDNN